MAEDNSGTIVALIVVGVVLIIALWILSKSVYIVHQAEGIVIERLGRFEKVLSSGINFVVPFVEGPRTFTWRKTYIATNGAVVDTTTTNTRIDLRESVFNFLRQEVYTKDTILLDVNSLMYYSIGDIKKAIYEVEDLQNAISNVAQTQLKDVFGNMTFSETLSSQHAINMHMKRNFAQTFAKWGIVVERIELLDMKPKSSTAQAMKAQMIAERNRRADFIQAEGNKAAMRLTSEGTKMVKFNMGVAEQEATRKRSEGEAGAKVDLARAESKALETIGQVISGESVRQTDYMLAQRYMELFRTAVNTIDTKVIYLPYEVTALTGMIKDLPKVYGRDAPRLRASAPPPAAAVGGGDGGGAPGDSFAELS
mmetsp:Transcript_11083/g.30392  ORF Transcript_11083/g.30392 Transcript_11083/m.30392 type:complete len:367 (-) Transcript_11083:93-1193(-)